VAAPSLHGLWAVADGSPYAVTLPGASAADLGWGSVLKSPVGDGLASKAPEGPLPKRQCAAPVEPREAEAMVETRVGVFDALSNLKRLKAFCALVYDKSPMAREAAVGRGFWKPAEEGGGFVVLGALAHLSTEHLPPQCNYLPPGFTCL